MKILFFLGMIMPIYSQNNTEIMCDSSNPSCASDTCVTSLPSFPHSICTTPSYQPGGYFTTVCGCKNGWNSNNQETSHPAKCIAGTGSWTSGANYCIYPTGDCIEYTCSNPDAIVTEDNPPNCKIIHPADSYRRLECNPEDPNCGNNHNLEIAPDGGGGVTYYCGNGAETLEGNTCYYYEGSNQGTCSPPNPPSCTYNPIEGGWCIMDGENKHADCGCYWGSHSELGINSFPRDCDPLTNEWTNYGTCTVCRDQSPPYIEYGSYQVQAGYASAYYTCDTGRLFTVTGEQSFTITCDHQNGWNPVEGLCSYPDCSYMPGAEWNGYECGCPSGTYEANGMCEQIPNCICGANWDQMYNTCVCNAQPDMTMDYSNNVCLDVNGKPYTACEIVCDAFTHEGECVTTCPDMLFGDPVSRTCVATCPSTYYADSTTQMCVQYCPADYFMEDEFRLCMSVCPSHLVGDRTSMLCVQTCPAGQSVNPNTNQCIDCNQILVGSSWDSTNQACSCASQYVDNGFGYCVYYNDFYCSQLSGSTWNGYSCVCPQGTYDNQAGACAIFYPCDTPTISGATSCILRDDLLGYRCSCSYGSYSIASVAEATSFTLSCNTNTRVFEPVGKCTVCKTPPIIENSNCVRTSLNQVGCTCNSGMIYSSTSSNSFSVTCNDQTGWSTTGTCNYNYYCGDGNCFAGAGESCSTCPQDCGECEYCGDGMCNNGETCDTCSTDCGTCPTYSYCGDMTCDSGESCSSCPGDCGSCYTSEYCGDAYCNNGETCMSCSTDCGVCPEYQYCGDGSCNNGETCDSCLSDCGSCGYCGDGTCNNGEDCNSCSSDCGSCSNEYCGDGTCNNGEDCNSCSGDCGSCSITEYCGDGICNNGETCDTCGDCGSCAVECEDPIGSHYDSGINACVCDDGTIDIAGVCITDCDAILPGSTLDTSGGCSCASQFMNNGVACVTVNEYYCAGYNGAIWNGYECLCPAGTYDDGYHNCIMIDTFCTDPSFNTASCMPNGQLNTWECICNNGYYRSDTGLTTFAVRCYEDQDIWSDGYRECNVFVAPSSTPSSVATSSVTPSMTTVVTSSVTPSVTLSMTTIVTSSVTPTMTTVITSSVTPTTSISPSPSKICQSKNFQGLEFYKDLVIGTTGSYIPNTVREFTWEFWAMPYTTSTIIAQSCTSKLSSIPAGTSILMFASGYHSYSGGTIVLLGTNTISIMVHSSGYFLYTLLSHNYAFPPDSYTHIVITADQTVGFSLYINGLFIKNSCGPLTSPYWIGTEIQQIGGAIASGGGADTKSFSGKIGKMSLWNKKLTAIEISNLFCTSATGSESGLTGFWKLEGATEATILKDYSSAGYQFWKQSTTGNVGQYFSETFENMRLLYSNPNIKYTVVSPIDNRAKYTAIGLTVSRIAYYLQFNRGGTLWWVYVSMPSFVTPMNNYNALQIPDNNYWNFYQKDVTGLVVISNHPSVGNYSGARGRVEIYGCCASATASVGDGSSAVFDYDDTFYNGCASSCGHGGFSVHNLDTKKTIFSWTGWHYTVGIASGVGIGNNDRSNPHFTDTSGSSHCGYADNPDWSCSQNAGLVTNFKLDILVGNPPPSPSPSPTSSLLPTTTTSASPSSSCIAPCITTPSPSPSYSSSITPTITPSITPSPSYIHTCGVIQVPDASCTFTDTVASCRCNDGLYSETYTPNFTLTCNSNYTWPSFGNCFKCSDPGDPFYSTRVTTTSISGYITTVSHSCINGFWNSLSLEEVSTAKCLPTGHWSPLIECSACKIPLSFANIVTTSSATARTARITKRSDLNINALSPAYEINLYCNGGYGPTSLTNNGLLYSVNTCSIANGTWLGFINSCITCRIPSQRRRCTNLRYCPNPCNYGPWTLPLDLYNINLYT